MTKTEVERLLVQLERIAVALEGTLEYAKRQEALQDEYRAKEASEEGKETPQDRYNDLWERQIKNGEDRLAVEQLHNEMHLRGTAHS